MFFIIMFILPFLVLFFSCGLGIFSGVISSQPKELNYSISCKTDLLAINPLSVFGNVFIFSFKSQFCQIQDSLLTGYLVVSVQLYFAFHFECINAFWPLLFLMRSQLLFLLCVGVCLICNELFLLLLANFSPFFCSQSFDHNVSWCVWIILHLLSVQIQVSHQMWEVLSLYFFIFSAFSLSSFAETPIMHMLVLMLSHSI